MKTPKSSDDSWQKHRPFWTFTMAHHGRKTRLMKAIENNSNHNSLSSETPNHIIKNQPAQVVGRLTMGL